MERKKKILIHSNFCLSKTGFGRHCKYLLSYLYKTNKYDLVEYASAPLTWSHPLCKALPWQAYGALPDNEKELEPYQHDPALIQAIKYGDYNINKVIELEKPDVIIMVEDIWGLPHFNKPWFNKVATVIWTPIDSLPILPVFKEHRHKFKNLWVKAKFARNALKEEGIEARFMPALIDNKDFNILSDERKFELRQKFGIARDTKIFGFVFRNQLRKLVGTLIEGFSIFQKKNPNERAKLLLHTSWVDNDGWRIVDFMNRFGVRCEDVLTTHICSKCRDISIRPFYGTNFGCKKCGSENSVNTVSPDFGVTESELCEIYNLCDAYVHPATSGGFEMPVLEAMLCGLSIAVPNYSFGEDFCENKNIFPLKYSISHERGSQFDKAQPFPESIVEFMETICNKSKEELKQLSLDIRKWAKETYDPDRICGEVEQFVDELPFVEYNFSFKDDKNENYSMPDIEDKKEFVIDLYKNIMNMDVTSNPAEINNAMQLFANGMTREQVYERFIEVARSYNYKKKKIGLSDLIDQDSNKKKLLYVEGGNFADCVDSLSVLEELSLKYNPNDWDFYIATQIPELFEHLPFIKRIIPYDPFLEDVLSMEGNDSHAGFFDMAFHPRYVRTCLDYFKNNN